MKKNSINPFKFKIHKAQICSNEDDKCVKIIEKRRGKLYFKN